MIQYKAQLHARCFGPIPIASLPLPIADLRSKPQLPNPGVHCHLGCVPNVPWISLRQFPLINVLGRMYIRNYYETIFSYTNWPKKTTFHSHVIAHSQRWGAPRLQVADILVLQFQALDSPGTAGTTRHAENQSSEILHCIVVSYIRAYTSYLHVCIYRCTSSR